MNGADLRSILPATFLTEDLRMSCRNRLQQQNEDLQRSASQMGAIAAARTLGVSTEYNGSLIDQVVETE